MQRRQCAFEGTNMYSLSVEGHFFIFYFMSANSQRQGLSDPPLQSKPWFYASHQFPYTELVTLAFQGLCPKDYLHQ